MADKADKGTKRKRHAEGSSNPSKKVAVDGDRKIKVSLRDAEKWAPVIVSPAGFSLPSSIPFNPYTKPRVNAPQRPGKSGSIATTELLLHSSAHPKLDYTIREEDSLQKHYVGIYDPETGKLEVTEARKMEVRGVVRAHQATEEQVHQNAFESRVVLGQLFGTKKARKAIASMTENAIGPAKADRPDGAKLDATSAAVVASMASATEGMATTEELQEQADASKPRPKANLSAKDIKDVYTIDSLMGAETVKHIPVMDWVESLQAHKEIIVSSRHVASRIQNQGSNVEKLKILRYMLFLIEFYNSSRPARNGGRMLPKRDQLKTALSGVPEPVLESMKRRFAEAGDLPRFKIHLLMTHVCALACLVDNFEVDMFNLQEDLKVEGKEMAKYFREIGAKIGTLSEIQRKALKLDKAAAAQRRVAKLKLPLDFPKVSYSRKVAR